MKRQVFGLAVLLVVLGAVFANAQSLGLVSNIPFSFNVGDVALPAGEYCFEKTGVSMTLRLSDSNRHSWFIPIGSESEAVVKANSELVFHHVNGQYFLASISMRTADNPINNSVFVPSRSRREREMLAQGAQPVAVELKASTRR